MGQNLISTKSNTLDEAEKMIQSLRFLMTCILKVSGGQIAIPHDVVQQIPLNSTVESTLYDEGYILTLRESDGVK